MVRSTRKKNVKQREEVVNSESDFSDDNEEVLNKSRQASFMKLNGGHSDSDSDSEEGVLDLEDEGASSSSGSDWDEDDKEEEMKEDMKEIEKIGKTWGSKRSDFFKSGEESESDEQSDEEDEEEAAEEEAEARRMKKQMLANVREEDFEIGTDDEADEPKKKSKKKKGKQQAAESSEDLERIAAQAPELLSLLSEFKSNLTTLETHITPVLGKLESHQAPTEAGMSYLESKFHAMLTYCINIAFYLYMKAQGESVRDHPVIAELVRVRSILEKLKPLDSKLKNQIDHLLASKPLSSTKAKPNARDLVADDSEESGQEEDDSDDDEFDQEEELPSSKRGKKSSAKYVAPKEMIVANTFEADEREEAKYQKKREKLRRKLKNSSLLQELSSEFTDRPMEEPSIGASFEDAENRRILAEKQRYEDEYFVRLRETKKEKADRRRRERDAQQGLSRSLEELQDFGDLEGVMNRVERDAAMRVGEKAKRQQELERFLNKAKTVETKSTSEYDVKVRDPEAIHTRGVPREDPEREERKQKRKESKLRKEIEASTTVDEMEEDELYREALTSSRAAKRARKEKYTAPDLLQSEPTQFVKDGQHRKATYKILKNQGLHAHKKKEDRNPRVRRRMLYEKKLKARKGQVLSMRSSEADNYQGEATGLRTDIVASRRVGK